MAAPGPGRQYSGTVIHRLPRARHIRAAEAAARMPVRSRFGAAACLPDSPARQSGARFPSALHTGRLHARRTLAALAALLCVLIAPGQAASATPAGHGPSGSASGPLALAGPAPEQPAPEETTATYAPPEITDGGPAPQPPAGGWLVGDAETGEVWAGEHIEQPFAPASTLKLFSALALEPVLDKDEVYTATAEEVRVDGTKVGMVDGGEYTIDQLFHAMIMSSANDASYALAEAAGGQERARELMADLADELGLQDSRAVNTSGLDADGQAFSARDLMVVAHHFAQNDYLMEVAGTDVYDWPGATDRDGRRWDGFQIQNHTRVAGRVDGGLGLKNGYTQNARGSFVALAERDGRRVVSVLLRNETMTREAAVDLLEWGFAQSDPEPLAMVRMDPPDDDEPGASAAPHPVAENLHAAADDDDASAGTAFPPAALWGAGALAVLALLLGLVIGLRASRGRRNRRRQRDRRSARRPGAQPARSDARPARRPRH